MGSVGVVPILLSMNKLQFFVAVLLLAGLLTSCKQEIDAAGPNNLAAIQEYATSKGISGTLTASGLYYAPAGQDTVSGLVDSLRKKAALGQELEFTYKLYIIRPSSTTAAVSDVIVDTAFAKMPTFVPFFDGALKAGLQEGLLLMTAGEKAVLLMPAKIAFGDQPTATVPANSPVRFDVTLRRARTETDQINEYVKANKLTFTETTPSGLRFVKTKTSTTGDSVKTAISQGKTVTLRYVGKQLHAKTAVSFDSTGTNLNQYSVAGFSEGLNKLRVGEKATLLFPSSIGYGKEGLIENKLYKVAPYAPLRYEVEVVSVR